MSHPDTRDRRGETFHRSLALDRATVDPNDRTVQASLSSEIEVERWFGREVLSHAPGAVDLNRAADGLPLLWNHDSDRPIGIVEHIRLADDRKLRGVLRFSRNPKAEEVFQDVREGLLRNLSIGYHIKEWVETANSDLVRVTQWELLETSIAPVPADPTVGIGRAHPRGSPAARLADLEAHEDAERSMARRPPPPAPEQLPPSARWPEGIEFPTPTAIVHAVRAALTDWHPTVSTPRSTEVSMSTETAVPAGVASPTPQPAAVASAPVVDLNLIRRDLDITREEARRQATMDERRRVADVASIFDMGVVPRSPEFAALRARALDEGWTADQTRHIVLQALDTGAPEAPRTRSDADVGIHHQAPVPTRAHPTAPAPAASVQAGDDAIDKFKRGVSEALIVRAGIDASRAAIDAARAGGFVGMRLSRMAERYLHLLNIDTGGLNDDQLAMRAMTTRASGMTTSDFANVLANTANKALLLGWEQAPETWQQWVRIGQVPDFKLATRTGLSGFSSLAVVPEDGEITYGKFTDRKETIQAISYAKKFRLTYQAIKNDDLSAFTAIPRGMGRAAQSVIGDVVYALLNNTGPTLNQDSTALFDTSGHANYTASAAAPSVATLDVGFTAMAMQKDPNNSKVLNIVPRFLLVPKALETTARTLAASQYDPGATGSSKNFMTPNPFQNRVEVVSDARLDGQTNGTTAWYLAADPNRFDTVEVAFVDGIAEPYLKEEQEWDTRGVEWVVGVDFGVAALDFRGLFKQKGAT
jgi:HK97 family phage prohead protease